MWHDWPQTSHKKSRVLDFQNRMVARPTEILSSPNDEWIPQLLFLALFPWFLRIFFTPGPFPPFPSISMNIDLDWCIVCDSRTEVDRSVWSFNLINETETKPAYSFVSVGFIAQTSVPLRTNRQTSIPQQLMSRLTWTDLKGDLSRTRKTIVCQLSMPTMHRLQLQSQNHLHHPKYYPLLTQYTLDLADRV
jgi:hypothetical protein